MHCGGALLKTWKWVAVAFLSAQVLDVVLFPRFLDIGSALTNSRLSTDSVVIATFQTYTKIGFCVPFWMRKGWVSKSYWLDLVLHTGHYETHISSSYIEQKFINWQNIHLETDYFLQIVRTIIQLSFLAILISYKTCAELIQFCPYFFCLSNVHSRLFYPTYSQIVQKEKKIYKEVIHILLAS